MCAAESDGVATSLRQGGRFLQAVQPIESDRICVPVREFRDVQERRIVNVSRLLANLIRRQPKSDAYLSVTWFGTEKSRKEYENPVEPFSKKNKKDRGLISCT